MRESGENTELTMIGEACLGFLAEDPAELERFMSLAGYSPQALRNALGSDGLSTGLLDYFVRHEPLLLAMCANTGISTSRVMSIWHRLNPES